VAYHGELEKKAAMEQKRVMTGENGETDGDGEYRELKDLVQDVEKEKENGFTMQKMFGNSSSLFCLQQIL
jgi:hypothetical protein